MSINVLIADDSNFIRKVIADILKSHETISIIGMAENGKDAVSKVKELKPDVLILDLIMPVMSGVEALKLIISEIALPVIILSAINPKMMDASMQALLLGAFDYIIKPGGIGSGELTKFKQEVLFKVLLASKSKIQRLILKGNKVSQDRSYLRQEYVTEAFKFGKYLNRIIPVSTDDDIFEEWEEKVTKKKTEEQLIKLLEVDEKLTKPSLRQDIVSEIFQKGLKKSNHVKDDQNSKRGVASNIFEGKRDVIKKVKEKTIDLKKVYKSVDNKIVIASVNSLQKEKAHLNSKPKISKDSKKILTIRKHKYSFEKAPRVKNLRKSVVPNYPENSVITSISSKKLDLKTKTTPKVTLDTRNYTSLLEYNIIVIGASVGGPKTITNIIKSITEDIDSPIVIVQHLNAEFIDIFVKTLNNFSRIPIKIAKKGEFLEKGVIYIAPGDKHTELTIVNKKPFIRTFVGTPVKYCMPSIDVLFKSAANLFRQRVLGILLTGMGEDGVQGLEIIKNMGGITIAESEETSILFGMPKNAIEKGLVDHVLPYYKIPSFIAKFSREKRT